MLTATMTSAAARPAAVRGTVAAAVPQRIADTLQGLQAHVEISRRVVHAGDSIYRSGDDFACLHVINSGFFKTVNFAADGREQVVGLHFKGDWLGFDGLATGHYACEAIAIDTGEIWAVRYDALLRCCAEVPALMSALHAAMSQEMARDRDFQLNLCTLPVDARVAEFLRSLVESLQRRDLRTDQITLRMSRAEIGGYLGMTLESASRALSRLAREQVIRFAGQGRREVQIPDVQALADFVQRSLAPGTRTLQ
jgi:CRP/FNR family transcriptional regulator